MHPFSFLKELFVPQKLKISQKLVYRLVEIDEEILVKHKKEITANEEALMEAIELFAESEEKFNIAKLSYEKKQIRFIELTSYNEDRLDIRYAQQGLQFKDVRSAILEELIDNLDLPALINELFENKEIIEEDVDICYSRTDFLLKLWDEISEELGVRLQRFEKLGLKVASNNLRLKLLPQLAEYKALLNTPMNEETGSRLDVDIALKDMIKQVQEDIYGELTASQEEMLNVLNHDMNSKELINLLIDENSRKDLMHLLSTDKIEIKLKKVIDNLF
jgi:hypothetical protein